MAGNNGAIKLVSGNSNPALAEAMKLVHDPAARGLPGYKPK